MMFGEILQEILRYSAYLTHIISLYVSARLVICAHKVYKATDRDRTSRLLLFTFSALAIRSVLNIILYIGIIFFDRRSDIVVSGASFVAQVLVLVSLIGFWRLHNGKEI